MNWEDLIKIVAAGVLSLGGGGAIVLGLASWIGKIFVDKYVEKLKHEFRQELESYKTRLRKSEILFQKEFEATSAFISLRRRLLPSYRIPEMEAYDAYEDFACTFKQVENGLESYIATHGAALQNETLKRIADAITMASEGWFEVSVSNGNFIVSRKGIENAEQVMNALEEIEKELYRTVWSQSDQGYSLI